MSLRAALWAILYFGLILVPMLVLLLVGERVPGRGFWLDLSMGLGFAGMAMIASQFALTARFRRATHPFGIDVLYYFHRILAIGGIGHYTDAPLKRELWLAITIAFLGLIVWTRIGKPARQLGQPWRVVENRPERGGAYTLVLEPERHSGFGGRWLPGQFAWLTLRASPFALKEHPFSMMTAPEEGPRLAFLQDAGG